MEQTDPDRFYELLAADSVGQLSGYTDLADSTVLDVGGGPGYFGTAFRSAGARYLPVEADVGELAASIYERAIEFLEAPIQRVTGFDTPFPYSLEHEYMPNADRVLGAIRKTLEW